MVTKEPYAEAVDDLWEILGSEVSSRIESKSNRNTEQRSDSGGKLDTDTIPSFEPSTDALSQPMRSVK